MKISNLFCSNIQKEVNQLYYFIKHKYCSVLNLKSLTGKYDKSSFLKIRPFSIDPDGNQLLCLICSSKSGHIIVIILQRTGDQTNLVYPKQLILDQEYDIENVFFFDYKNMLKPLLNYEIVTYFNILLRYQTLSFALIEELKNFPKTMSNIANIPEKFQRINEKDQEYVFKYKLSHLYEYLNLIVIEQLKESVSEPELEPEVESEVDTTSESKSEPKSEPEVDTTSESEPKSEPKSEPESEAESKSEPEVDSDNSTFGSDSESKSDSEADTIPDFILEKRQTFIDNITLKINNENSKDPEFHLTYPIYTLDKRDVNYLIRQITRRNNYDQYDHEFIEQLSSETGIASRIIRSIRGNTLIEMATRGTSKVDKYILDYVKTRNLDMSDLNIENVVNSFSREYKTHPGSTYNRIINLSKYNSEFKKYLTDKGYDLKINPEIKKHIFNNDFLSPETSNSKSKVAKKDENFLLDLFRSFNIQFKTEDDIRDEYYNSISSSSDKEQVKLITPDMLLLSKVFINGHEIKWIEYKSYSCTGKGIVNRKNNQQYCKYLNQLGNGLVLYGGAISENVLSNYPVTLGMDLNQ